MNEIGEILHVAKSGRIIAKITPDFDLKKIGHFIFNHQGKKIGKLSELLGPIISPYASIIPEKDYENVKLGDKLYEMNIPPRRNYKSFLSKRTKKRQKK